MGLTKIEGQFGELCQKYEKWIVQYNSTQFESAIFLIWITDSSDNEEDKLILDSNLQIIGSKSVRKLLESALELGDSLADFQKSRIWIEKGLNMEINPFMKYEIDLLRNSLESELLKPIAISEGASFVNLFDDFAKQNKSEKLLGLSNKNSIRSVWSFYYKTIFWPRFEDKEGFSEELVPDFIATDELKRDYNQLITEFENRIVLV